MQNAEHSISRFFQFSHHQTDWQTETLAGITTFMTMGYILAVNPDILSNGIFLAQPGDLFAEIAIATALSAAFATLFMGLVAKYPFALAPGMGLNAFFAFSVTLGMGIEWRVALAAVFLEGIVFIFLTWANLRRWIIAAIPGCLRSATATGIGLFLAYIALSRSPEAGGAGIIVADPNTLTRLGDFSRPETLLAVVGILLTGAFVARRVTGALLWGILATAVLAWISGVTPAPTQVFALPELPKDLWGQAFVGFSRLGTVSVGQFLSVLFALLFVDLFDTVGTLAGVSLQAGYLDRRGELPRANQAFMADAVGTTVGAILGTSTVTTYIESAAGVAVGGRTGFASVVTAALFALSVFFIPLLASIPAFATAPALLVVGVLMTQNVRSIRWDDPAESIPAFLTILVMPLSFSIADGLAVGFISYPLMKAFQGKVRETSIASWVLAVAFFLKFTFDATEAL
ncbi:guanine permease [Leptolyngbya valderiana BDU 20041]|nr:guanine permease [Leptolyngbya valderiana BDU 20041]PPT05981.1 Xanthine/uracil/thiamine/ascorbate permease family protein [Geitlerinema sp. FC II]